jgi:large subunit ribosomal protein L18
MAQVNRVEQREIRRRRVRAKVAGTQARPRLNVFRSLTATYVQVIDDVAGSTLVSASSSDKEIAAMGHLKKLDAAREVGKLAARRALAKEIKQVVFDRAGYLYHGRIKAVAEGAREGGLEF